MGLVQDVTEADIDLFSKIIAIFNEALDETKLLKIVYKDSEGKLSTREIEPMELKTTGGDMMAWCTTKDAVRRFKLANIQAIEKTDKIFIPKTFG